VYDTHLRKLVHVVYLQNQVEATNRGEFIANSWKHEHICSTATTRSARQLCALQTK